MLRCFLCALAAGCFAAFTCTASDAAAGGRCLGDCDADGAVSVAELVLGVNIAQGRLPIATCPAFDGNGDSRLRIDELVDAVNAAAQELPCTLRAAAARAGIRVGMLGELGDAEWNGLIAQEFDAIVTHGLSWNTIHPQPDVWNFEPADAVIDFAERHGLFVTAMHYVWEQDLLDDAADWVLAIDDPDELRHVLQAHLRTIAGRYAARINRMTVVNEPMETFGGAVWQNHFYRVLGPNYIAEIFRIAAEEAPHTQRFLNDNLIAYRSDKAAGLVALARDLVEQGAPIDGVGIQGHLFFGEPDWGLLESTIRQIELLGLTVAFTEVDSPVSPDLPDRFTRQAEWMAGIVRLCLGSPACDSVTWWGLSDRTSWLDWFLAPGLDPLLFDAALRPKPAYDSVLEALRAGRRRGATR